MKVVVAAPFALWSPHLETDLEIIQNHLDAKDEVTVLGCNGELAACAPNPGHVLTDCIRCVSRRRAGLKLLDGPFTFRPLVHLRRQDRDEIARLKTDFSDSEELREMMLDEFDLGWGVLSTLVSCVREPRPSASKHADLIKRLVTSAATTFRSVQNHLDEIQPDRIYVFNGRFAVTRAVLRAAQSRKVDCYMHERGSTTARYSLYKNRMIHDPTFYQELVREFWQAADPQEAAVMGASFFIEAAQGISHSWTSYVTKQTAALPAGWDPQANNIALFPSSEDEFTAIGEVWKHPIYRDQDEGIRRIVASLRQDRGLHLYIRLHPNQATMGDQSAARELIDMREPHVTVIPPGSPVGTYALMKNATRVLTFGSTTGIEAVYWGKPSILACTSYYDALGGTFNPTTHEELVELLRRPGLAPRNKEAALMYGYYARSSGHRYRHFEAAGLFGGAFRGATIQPTRLARLGARFMPLGKRADRVHLRLISLKNPFERRS